MTVIAKRVRLTDNSLANAEWASAGRNAKMLSQSVHQTLAKMVDIANKMGPTAIRAVAILASEA